MDYLSPDTVFYVSQIGQMILRRTINGGQSWEEFPIEVGYDYQQNGMKFYDYNNGLILCDWYILKTSDAGESWADVNSGNQTLVRFLDAAYVTSQRVFVIGDDYGAGSSVWQSDDGGETWNPVIEITGDEYHTIYFRDEYVGFIADYNEILKTDDGGETWSDAIIHSEGDITIKDIHFPTPQVGYAVGNGLKVIKTEDSGNNWYPIENEFTSNLSAVHFFDENHGIVMGENGIILRTDNGGTTFIEEKPAIPQQPSAITLFPNPATEILNITFEDPQQRGELIFYTTNGTEVMRRTHNPNVAGIIMNVDRLDAGAYVVQYVVDSKIIETTKIVIR
jgi:photosystem II stability/assembly factor-like uncharacterized protein